MRTFAWFQAQAQVNVSASSADPVEITVSAPDATPITTTLFEYNSNGTVGYTGSAGTFKVSDDNTSNFTQVNFLSTGTIWPGRKKSFAIKISSTGTMPNLNVKVAGISKTNDSNRKILEMNNSVLQATNKIIDIQKAYKMSAALESTNSVSSGTLVVGTVNNSSQANIVLNEQWYPANQTGSDRYFFYTIEFVDYNDANYPRYDEYIKVINQDESISYIAAPSTPASDYDGERFFYLNNPTGNSNCYAGLSLNLTDISITAG